MKRPLGDMVALRPIAQETEEVKGGIIIVKSAEPVSRGVVLQTSEDIESKVASGDTVLYPRGAGTTIKNDGEEILLISEKLLLAIL